jgi:hypothetical protein
MQPGERQIFGTSRFGQPLSSENPKVPRSVTASIGDQTREAASTVGVNSKELRADIQETVAAGMAYAQAQGKSFVREATSVIRRNAIPSLLISFGLGVLLAQVLEGKRR